MVQQAGYDVTYSSRSLCCFLTMCTKGHSRSLLWMWVWKTGLCVHVWGCSGLQWNPSWLFFPLQFVELMSRRQGELDALVATGYKSALTEERRRYCFLVDRQCCVTKLLINYHSKVTYSHLHSSVTFQRSCTEILRLRCLYWFVPLFKLNDKSVLLLSSNPMKRLKSTINLSY